MSTIVSKRKTTQLSLVALIFCLAFSSIGYAGNAKGSGPVDAIENTQFIQVPGPNPILKPGPKGSWDEGVMETSDAFRDVRTYYLYYHATGGVGYHYQLGVASAPGPLGPFKKHGDKPILELGPKGSWDSSHAACAMILKEGPEEYYMWYSGTTSDDGTGMWHIGLATAKHPLGPWKKHENNPVLKDFGYMGGVLKVDGKYRLYVAHPITPPGYKRDYSPLAVAVGDKPEGPFVKYRDNPLMGQGKFGDWDDGGTSEAEVLYHNGMYHMFYGGAEFFGPRLEHVGYAYSKDGYNFIKHSKNPIVSRFENPNAASFSEVHVIMDVPFIYLYHTLRYERLDGHDYPWVEDIGVQVLATQRPFSLEMPVINLDTLKAGQKTSLDDSTPLCLGNINDISITAECTYSKNAKKPITIHIVSSPDGMKYDTTDLFTFDNDFKPGKTARKTLYLDKKVRYIKVTVENTDQSQSVSDVNITASLKG